MNATQKIVYAVITAILAGVLTFFTEALGGFPIPGMMERGATLTAISYCCWSSYFVCGCTPKAAFKWWISMLVGICAAICCCMLTVIFMGPMGYLIGVSVAVVVVVIFMMLTDEIKLNTSGVFLGCGLFFTLNASGALSSGFILPNYGITLLGEAMYAMFGLVCGFLTIIIMNKCLKIGVKKNVEAKTETNAD